MSKPIALAIHLDGDGAHPAAWRFAAHSPKDLLTAKRIIDVVTLAETAGFSFATFAGGHLPPGDSSNITARLDPLQVAAFAGPLTTRIGLVPEVDVTYVEPFHIANQFASLDHVSRGRGGWLVRGSGTEAEARAYGGPSFDEAALSQEAADVIEVNRRLWDSWEEDAVIRDTTTWKYIDREKLHFADFQGTTFSVKGTSYVPRPPQGQLPIFSHDGVVDPRMVDATIVHASTIDDLPAVAANARDRGANLIAADLEIVLDSRGESASTRLARLNERTAWAPGNNPRVVGGTEYVNAAISSLAETIDIIRLIPAVIDVDLPELRYTILPELLQKGVIAAPQTGTTLRETLGLGIAINRYVVS